jgi:hypothetical protein
MAFEKGHKHGAKSRLFDGALRRAIAQDDGERLRRAAEALLDEAAAGKPWALAQLADRLDGKADQTVNVNRNLESMSLVELAAEVAQLRGGDSAQAEGSDELSGLH